MRHIRIISLLLALSLLTACAAAPEQSAVTRKDQQQLIETAGSLKDTGLTIADQVNAPERWEA
jgi:outer membrane biogenesis lipoprotein LolB